MKRAILFTLLGLLATVGTSAPQGQSPVKRAIVQRQVVSGTVAVSAWLMPNDTVRIVNITQAQYDAMAKIGVSALDSVKPGPRAMFFWAAGGRPRLDTPNGYSSIGDAWEVGGGKIRMRVGGSEDIDYCAGNNCSDLKIVSTGNVEDLDSGSYTGSLPNITLRRQIPGVRLAGGNLEVDPDAKRNPKREHRDSK